MQQGPARAGISPALTRLTKLEMPLAFQRLLAVLETLLDLGDRVHAGFSVLVLDVGGNLPAFVAQQMQHGHDGRVTLAKGQIRAMILLSILNVQGDDFMRGAR